MRAGVYNEAGWSSYNRGDYSGAHSHAQEQVNFLDPVDGQNPVGPESWIVDGVIHPTYEAALAMEIEWLWSTEGGAALASAAEPLLGS
jgi:hypothetical protein